MEGEIIMPNHITNKLTIIGTEDQVNTVKEFIKIEKVEENQEIFGHGTIDFNKITPMPKWVFQKNLSFEDEEKYGRENCWYGWSIDNWGTKWNAYQQSDLRTKENVLYFTTAWSCPIDLIKKLSWIFPEIELEIAWVDENLGYNLGIIKFKDGEIIEEILPEGGSFGARKLFFEITQESHEDYGMNENYEYIDED